MQAHMAYVHWAAGDPHPGQDRGAFQGRTPLPVLRFALLLNGDRNETI